VRQTDSPKSLSSRSTYLAGLCLISAFIWAVPEVKLLGDVLPAGLILWVHRTFSLELENNIGAWWSGGLLFLAGLHALDGYKLHSDTGRRELSYAWVVIAGLMIALSLDEIGSLHERVLILLPPRVSITFLATIGTGMIASVAWASRQLWTDRASRGSIVWIAIAMALFASVAGQEYLEVSGAWRNYLSHGRWAIEEGTEVIAMLLLVTVTSRNSGGVFAMAGSTELARPTFWSAYSTPAWVYFLIVVFAPLVIEGTTWLTDIGRGRPSDWLGAMLWLMAAVSAGQAYLLKLPQSGRQPPLSGTLLLAASAACVAVPPHWTAGIGALVLNQRLTIIAFLLLTVAVCESRHEQSGVQSQGRWWFALAAGTAACAAANLSHNWILTVTVFGAMSGHVIAAPNVRRNVAGLFLRRVPRPV
jgi:hypothetical protein